jgi:hypothetical protein
MESKTATNSDKPTLSYTRVIFKLMYKAMYKLLT